MIPTGKLIFKTIIPKQTIKKCLSFVSIILLAQIINLMAEVKTKEQIKFVQTTYQKEIQIAKK